MFKQAELGVDIPVFNHQQDRVYILGTPDYHNKYIFAVFGTEMNVYLYVV